MMTDREKIEGLYGFYWDVAKEPLATAVLVLTHITAEAVTRLDHKVALGVRHGLFGSDAPDDASLLTVALSDYCVNPGEGNSVDL